MFRVISKIDEIIWFLELFILSKIKFLNQGFPVLVLGLSLDLRLKGIPTLPAVLHGGEGMAVVTRVGFEEMLWVGNNKLVA